MRGHLSDQLREVGFCRQRLDELAGLIQSPPSGSTGDTKLGTVVAAQSSDRFEKNLLPAGCKRIGDVVARLDEQLVEDDFAAFDDRIQAHVKKQYKAFLNVCLGPSAMVRALAPMMLQDAAVYLDERFTPPNVVELLQARVGKNEAEDDLANQLGDVIRELYDEAAPELKRLDEERQLALAGLPNDEAGEPLRAAVALGLPQVKIVVSDRCDEVVFLREQILQSLSDLEQTGPIAQEAYRQRLAQDSTSLHSREDIADWMPDGAPVG
jgi:hypothetical protein